jgi:MinD-like ATPase involved in chromosome partitioning or flagellar assembly
MSKVIAIHSFKGGTGKSNTTANLAALLAADGRRVGVLDCDLQSPGIHTIFGVDQQSLDRTLNDYLWDRCRIEEAALDVTPAGSAGGVWLVPASMRAADIARIMREGYDVELMTDGVRALIKELALDVLLLDTHPGLSEETLLSLAISNALAIVLRPDRQDFEGTRVTVTVARKLKVPRIVLVVNKVPSSFDAREIAGQVESTFGCQVGAVLPHSDELMALSSGGIFALRYPDHPVTSLYRTAAECLTS